MCLSEHSIHRLQNLSILRRSEVSELGPCSFVRDAIDVPNFVIEHSMTDPNHAFKCAEIAQVKQ